MTRRGAGEVTLIAGVPCFIVGAVVVGVHALTFATNDRSLWLKHLPAVDDATLPNWEA